MVSKYSLAFAQVSSQVHVDLLPILGLGHKVTHCLAGAEYPNVLPGQVLTHVLELVTYQSGEPQVKQSVAKPAVHVRQVLSQESHMRVRSFLY